MRAEAVCGGQAGMKIAIRMDDITPDMNWDNFLALKALFDRYHICPLIGVVPDNRDDGLRIMEPREDFCEGASGGGVDDRAAWLLSSVYDP